MSKTCGLVLVGDELLDGSITDSNGAWLLVQLHGLGVQVREVSVLPDEVSLLSEALVRQHRRWDVVLTSGGMGPTHDDKTMEAVADALEVPLEEHAQMRAHVLRHFAHDPEGMQAWLTMARLPRGASLLRATPQGWPVIQNQNIWSMPGSPRYMRAQFEALRPLLRGRASLKRAFFFAVSESVLASPLREVSRACPEVRVGSYPATAAQTWSVKVILQARTQEALDRATQALAQSLPEVASWIATQDQQA